MGNFNQGGERNGDKGGFRHGGGGRDFGRPDFQNRDRGERGPSYRATCAECGKACEVPFMPKGGRPVYCADCFAKRGGVKHDGGGDRGERKDFRGNSDHSFQRPAFEQPRTDGDTKRRLESIEYKIDKLIRSVDLLLSAKLPSSVKTTESKPKDPAKVKAELTAAVVKAAEEANKELKSAKAKKEAKPEKKTKTKAKK